MGISFVARVCDPQSGTLRLPENGAEDPDAFEVNVCNANGADLLRALGLPSAPEGGPAPIEAFRALVTAALRRHLGHRSPALPIRSKGGADGGMAMVSVDRREGYLETRLGDLARMAQRGREAGATHVIWG